MHAHAGRVALNFNFRNAGGIQRLLQIFPEIIIGHDGVTELVVLDKPAGIPVLDNADPQAVGIDFLTHSLPPPRLFLFLENQGDV